VSERGDQWAGRRVLVTGHTGFKGGWLSLWLAELGAQVTGLSLEPEPGGFCEQVDVPSFVDSRIVDILDRPALQAAVVEAAPQVIFHLAAQALVIPGIAEPARTFDTNVVGTANVLECTTGLDDLQAVVVVTSDKVYENDASGRPFEEGDRLGGGDPYSASKAATELVVASWRHTYADAPPIVTARAGNVIGGGDVATDRLFPDLLRAFAAGEDAVIRNPTSTRPWQFVLEPVGGYLAYAEALLDRRDVPAALNFGPDRSDARTVAEMVDRAIECWGSGSWRHEPVAGDIEAPVLTLDASLAGRALGWHPVLDAADAAAWTVDWVRAQAAGDDLAALARHQLDDFRRRTAR
jgi:CDP-glucose 4,6-dehydratase